MSRPSPQTERVVALLDLLAATPERSLTLAEVTRGLGVHKATCHSMLQSLTASGWLRRDPVRKTYHLGPGLVRLGEAAASRASAVEFARSAMSELAVSTGAHCLAFQPNGEVLTLAAQVRAPGGGGHPMTLGTELPFRPPYGAAIVAWGDRAGQDAWMAKTPADVRARYRRAMAAVRRRGFAIGLHVLSDARILELAELIRHSERPEGATTRVTTLAEQLTAELMHNAEWFPISLKSSASYDVRHLDAPIFDEHQQVAILLSLVPSSSPLSAPEIAALGQQLRGTAARVSQALGAAAVGPLPPVSGVVN